MQRKAVLKSTTEFELAEKEEDFDERMKRWEKQQEFQSSVKEQQRKEKLHQENIKKRCQKENIHSLEEEEYTRRQILDQQLSEMASSAAKRRDLLAKHKAEVQCCLI